MSSITSEPLLVRFFTPGSNAPDSKGRTLSTMLSWSDSRLESSHDYIQTLFPLPEASMANLNAPIITPETHAAFATNPALRANFRAALDRMLAFYCLELSPRDLGEGKLQKVSRADNFDTAARNWVTRFDHNHLRLTRILRSLRVLGLAEEAKALHAFLSTDDAVTRTVSPKSRMYWRRAAERPLHLPPDEDDETEEGVSWLAEVE